MRPTLNRRRRASSAFTLIELLVVIVILAILATVVIVRVTHRVGDAKQAKAKTDITALAQAVEQYKLDIGHYPPSLDALVSNVEQSDKWTTKYINSIPKNPWDPKIEPPYNYTIGEGGSDFLISVVNPENGETIANE